MRAALSRLPAACAVDVASAWLTAGSSLLASCACRCTKTFKGAGARTPPRIPGRLCVRHQLPSKPSPGAACGERKGCGTLRAPLPQTGLEFDLC